MRSDDRPVSKRSRVDGSRTQVDWPDSANDAREAAFRRLHQLVRDRDAVPEDVFVSANSSFDLRSIDDELAALVYDSIIDDALLAGVRSSGPSTRQLTFAASGLVVEIEVSDAGRLVGQIVPPQAAEVELRHRAGTTPVPTDDLGCFSVPVLPDGPVSFRCHPTRFGADSVATSWITL